MANTLTSKRPPLTPADIAALDARVPGGVHASWLEFLLHHNVAVPANPRFLALGEDFHVNHFLGVSPAAGEDCAAVLEFYGERLAPGHLPIADADGGNLVCMARDTGAIYFWDHERHDRSDDPDDDEPPVEVARSLTAFIDHLAAAAPEPVAPPPRPDAVIRKSADFDELFKDYLK